MVDANTLIDYRIRRRLEESGPVTQLFRAAPEPAPVVKGLLPLHTFEMSASKAGAATAYALGVVHDPAKSGRFIDLFNRLEKMRSLRDDWNSYGAEAPNPRAIFYAQEILSSLMHRNLLPDRVNPSAENGITFSFRRGERYADIECFNSGEILAVTTDGNDEPEVWNVSLAKEEVHHTLERIRAALKID
jgi:hypothetical protein